MFKDKKLNQKKNKNLKWKRRKHFVVVALKFQSLQITSKSE